MKDSADTPRPRKTAPKATSKTTAKKAAAPKAKKEAAVKAPKSPSKKVSAETTVAEKKPSRVTNGSPTKKAVAKKTNKPSPGADDLKVAAFLNWCQRRKQGLPDDALADWIAAESDTGLAN